MHLKTTFYHSLPTHTVNSRSQNILSSISLYLSSSCYTHTHNTQHAHTHVMSVICSKLPSYRSDQSDQSDQSDRSSSTWWRVGREREYVGRVCVWVWDWVKDVRREGRGWGEGWRCTWIPPSYLQGFNILYILKCILTNQMTLFEGYNVVLLAQRYLCCTEADQLIVDSNLLGWVITYNIPMTIVAMLSMILNKRF